MDRPLDDGSVSAHQLPRSGTLYAVRVLQVIATLVGVALSLMGACVSISRLDEPVTTMRVGHTKLTLGEPKHVLQTMVGCYIVCAVVHAMALVLSALWLDYTRRPHKRAQASWCGNRTPCITYTCDAVCDIVCFVLLALAVGLSAYAYVLASSTAYFGLVFVSGLATLYFAASAVMSCQMRSRLKADIKSSSTGYAQHELEVTGPFQPQSMV